MKYLNVGCGKRIHPAWINMDMFPQEPGVIHTDLTKGLPFEDSSIDIVYHSHVLEHIPKVLGKKFIDECFRVLKPGGILRVAVPDLEPIVRNYLKYLEMNLDNATAETRANYEWTLLELFDQVRRHTSEGEMGSFLKEKIVNKEFLLERNGEEIRPFLDGTKTKLGLKAKMKKFGVIPFPSKMFIVKTTIESLLIRLLPWRKYAIIGKFRTSGEVHQHMYDRYSLSVALHEAGFKEIQIRTAFTSYVDNWDSFNLDGENGVVFKPDSLFMEAKK